MPWVDSSDIYAADPATPKEIAQVVDYTRRRTKPRFYADENFPTLAVEMLRSMGARVVTVQDVLRRRHPDENHTAYALKHGLILLTCDRDYLDNRRFPLVHCPVIVVFNFGSGSTEEIQKAFICLWTAFKAPQFWDKWMKIDASPESWTQHTRHYGWHDIAFKASPSRGCFSRMDRYLILQESGPPLWGGKQTEPRRPKVGKLAGFKDFGHLVTSWCRSVVGEPGVRIRRDGICPPAF